MTRVPTSSIPAMNAATLPSVINSGASSVARSTLPSPFNKTATGGRSTSAKTMTRSSTMSQPTAMRPRSVSTRRPSCKARKTTTVLATDSARPKTAPAPMPQPNAIASPKPSSATTTI